MASHPPDSGTADFPGSKLTGDGSATRDLSTPVLGSQNGGSDIFAPRQVDSRVVVIPSSSEGVHPADVLPDEKTVISAAKSLPPPADLIIPAGAKRAAQYLGETLIGRRLEHYELVEFVGGGGMGAVFRANDTRLGRTVAVKVLSRDQSSEENVRRFRNEAQSAARLDHRYIARVHYVGEDAGLNFIVFEFIKGINIRELVQERGPLPLDEALRYTMQVAEALSHASQRDVVHRDIKPSNVLVTPEGHVKLVDMGLARLHQVDSSFDDLTASGVTLGTFDYISPEQARDPRVADVRSDIYSLGCTLYFMLVGKPPFPDGSAMQKLLNHSGEDPPDVRLFRPEIATAVTPLLAKMLAKRPVQRHQTAQELVADIERIARDLGLDVGPTVADHAATLPATQPGWSGLIASIAVPIAVLVLVLIGIEVATKPPAEEIRVQLRPSGAMIPLEIPSKLIGNSVPEATPGDVTNSKTSNGATGNGSAGPNPGEVTGNGEIPPPVPAPVNTLIDRPLDVGPPPDSVASRGTPGEAPKIDIKPAIPSPPAPKIVVRPGAISTETNDLAGSLSQAIRRAAEKGIAEVELDFNGEMVEYPFEVPAGRMLVHPAPGRKPVVVFRPELSTVADQRQMIHLLGGASRLWFQDLDVRLELPSEPSYGWSLFSIHQGQTLELNNCVLTVADRGNAGAPVHEKVFFVQLLTRRLTETMKMDDEMTMIAPAAIELSDCLVRGEATFLSVPEELPVRLKWDQGLFISSKRLIETGGAIAKPRWHGRIELALDRVTIAAQQGLFQMKRQPDAAHQLDLEVTSDRSIFSVGSEAPLFEFAGMPSVDDIHFSFSGADNCYPREEMIFLRAKPLGAGEGPIDFNLADRGRWAGSERSPDLGVVWESPPAADLPAHAQLPENYRLSDSSPHAAGFRLDDLPRPVEQQIKAVKPATEATSPEVELPSGTPSPKPMLGNPVPPAPPEPAAE
ncbi:serine/threonine-protein kinase [Anatilimnocola aggregata]|nr:serine/threonine-protein kinase [Anatilimnocola aggregata]